MFRLKFVLSSLPTRKVLVSCWLVFSNIIARSTGAVPCLFVREAPDPPRCTTRYGEGLTSGWRILQREGMSQDLCMILTSSHASRVRSAPPLLSYGGMHPWKKFCSWYGTGCSGADWFLALVLYSGGPGLKSSTLQPLAGFVLGSIAFNSPPRFVNSRHASGVLWLCCTINLKYLISTSGKIFKFMFKNINRVLMKAVLPLSYTFVDFVFV